MYSPHSFSVFPTLTSGPISSGSELRRRMRLTRNRESGRLTDTQAGLWLRPARVRLPEHKHGFEIEGEENCLSNRV